METLAQDVLNACLTTQNLKLGFFLTEYDGKVFLSHHGTVIDILTPNAPVIAVRNRCNEILEMANPCILT